jgi:hypothetical protein
LVNKTTIYFPDDLKAAVEAEAARRGTSEAEVVRQAVRTVVGTGAKPEPRPGVIQGAEQVAERAEEFLGGFGQW